MTSRRTSFWLQLVLVLSLLLPSAAIFSQPSVPETRAAFVKPSKHEKHDKDKGKKAAKPKKHDDEAHAKARENRQKSDEQIKEEYGPNSSLADSVPLIDHDGHLKSDEEVQEELGITPESTVEPTPAPKTTKKQRKAARETESLSLSAAAFAGPAPAQDARMVRYYGAADNRTDAFFPWQVNVGFDKIEDLQREVNGKPSHWKITNCGVFCGWDIFPFGRVRGGIAQGTDAKWAEFEVNRPTMVGYVVRDGGGPPPWLAQQGWVDSGTLGVSNPEKGWTDNHRVFTKDFPAGRIAIPGPSRTGESRILPWILFAEAGGAAPTMPASYTPNQKCADAVHNAIKNRTGYLTWHLPYDTKSWCYFTHEHGSNPALIFGADVGANMPEYGYFDQFPGHKESHFGHKGYAITVWPEADFYVTHHFGATGVGRFNTCEQRFHLVEVSAMNKAHTVLLYKIRMMADYGEVSGVSKSGDDPADDHSINPPGCPDGNAQAAADAIAGGYQPGARREGIAEFFDPPNPAGLSYGPWRFAKKYCLTLAICNGQGGSGAFVVNTQDALDSYRSHTDLTMISDFDRSGTARFLTINETTFGCPTNLPATKRDANGYWYTDMMGVTVYDLANRPASAVRQYCRPGWTGTAKRDAGTLLASHLSGPDATTWGGVYVAGPGGIPGDFERSITDAHGPN
jgi:hypothetical protein